MSQIDLKAIETVVGGPQGWDIENIIEKIDKVVGGINDMVDKFSKLRDLGQQAVEAPTIDSWSGQTIRPDRPQIGSPAARPVANPAANSVVIDQVMVVLQKFVDAGEGDKPIGQVIAELPTPVTGVLNLIKSLKGG